MGNISKKIKTIIMSKMMSMVPSKCCMCLPLDTGVQVYQIILHFELLAALGMLVQSLGYCLAKPPAIADFEWNSDPYAYSKY